MKRTKYRNILCQRPVLGLPSSHLVYNIYICIYIYIYMHIYIGWVGVGWRPRCKTRLYLREIDSQGTVFFLSAVTTTGGPVGSFLCGENLNSAQRGMIVSRRVHTVRYPRGSCALQSTHCCLWKWPHQKTNRSIEAAIHMRESPPQNGS